MKYSLSHWRVISLFILALVFSATPVCGLAFQDQASSDATNQQDATATEKGVATDLNKSAEESLEPANDAVDTSFLFSGKNPSSLAELRAMQERVREVYDKVRLATVNIRVGDAQGSGIIVSRDGYILTAAHVIVRPGLDAVITLADNRQISARTLGINRGLDSGMLKIKNDESWPYIDVGISGDLVKGQWVMAIGHPGGLDRERGLVIRAGRVLASTKSVLRTDCVLVGGDSGGPLVDMNGDLIGIHSRIGTNLWDNIHVPVDAYSDEWDQLVNEEMVGQKQVPYLGIDMKEDTNVVASVRRDSPAAKGGLEVNDEIIRFNGETIKDKKDLNAVFKNLKIDDEVEVVVIRGDEEKSLKIKIGKTWD